jgi:hypothetical protein
MSDAAQAPQADISSRLKSSFMPVATANTNPSQTGDDVSPAVPTVASVQSTFPEPLPVQTSPSDSEKLDIMLGVLDKLGGQVEQAPSDSSQPPAAVPASVQDLSTIGQAWPQAFAASDPLNPPHAVRTGPKEATESTASPDQTGAEVTGIQYVEEEKNPEIPVEVEGYLQSVEERAAEKPPEIIIADGSGESENVSYPSRPVVVLPITEEVEEAGKKKNPNFSIRWLVEWSQRIIKMFAGKVVYKRES